MLGILSTTSGFSDLIAILGKRFREIEERFNQMDKRFEDVDKRFTLMRDLRS